MRLLIISFAILLFGSCGASPSKEKDTVTPDRMKLDYIEARLSVLQGELDSAKRAGADSNTLGTYSALIEFLKGEKVKINAAK